jgi:LPXTG-site transpeptidase (sortase) family protein
MLSRSLVAVTALVAIAGLACGAQTGPTGHSTPLAGFGRSVLDDVQPANAPAPPPLVPARPPTHFQIPSIGVDAGVEHVPFLAVPQDPSKVAWFRTGPAPGEAGAAVFDGHLDWTTGPAVFWHLRDVKVGDQLIVSGESTPPLTFVVTEVDVVSAASTPPAWLYATDGPPELTLITCEGIYNRASGFGYNDRLLVRSALQLHT